MGLVDYSRVTTRGRHLSRIDTNAALERACALLGKRIESTGATIRYGHLEPVVADDKQLTQLFRALLENALTFRSADAPVVSVTQARSRAFDPSDHDDHDDHDEWLFSVIDNGAGFEPQYAERIFGMFERLHVREAYPGPGMGLALCKRILSRHDGRIWSNSAVGRGSTFCFTLPERG